MFGTEYTEYKCLGRNIHCSQSVDQRRTNHRDKILELLKIERSINRRSDLLDQHINDSLCFVVLCGIVWYRVL